MITAKEARKYLEEIMMAFPKKKIPDFFAQFNNLDLYLIAQVEKEK